MCVVTRRGRAGYTSITRHSQVLNHQSDDTEVSSVPEVYTTSTASLACSKEYTPNAPNPVKYTLYGYKHSNVRTYLYHSICIVFLGIPYLISHSSLRFFVWLKLKTCDLNECDCVLG